MAHLLSGLKRSFRVDFGGVLPQEGDLDLSTMDDDGKLVGGKHKPKAGGDFKINGRAYDCGSTICLEFDHEDGSGHFEGTLVFASADEKRLVVAGIFTTDAFRKGLTEQEQEPWVITKP